MAKRRGIQKPLIVTAALALAVSTGISAAMARGGGGGGGHCGGGGGHCGGSHISSGAHFGGSSHFSSATHFGSATHFSGGHAGTCHVSSFHTARACSGTEGNSGKHGFSLFGGHTRPSAPVQQMTGLKALRAPNSDLHIQEIPEHVGSPSPYCSSIIRPEAHAGLLGHIHRMFGGNPCQLQNIHTEIMPIAFTEVACAPAPCVTHQFFSRENLALNQINAQSKYLSANAVNIRYLNSFNQSNRNFYTTQLPDNYFSVNVDNTVYPATDLDTVIANDNPNNVNVEVMAENEAPTFSGLNYMLPNPGGILSIYFSYESSINNFLQLHKASFLAAAMHQLL